MDSRAAKLALARQKLKNHQERKVSDVKSGSHPIDHSCLTTDLNISSNGYADVQSPENSNMQCNVQSPENSNMQCNVPQPYPNSNDINVAEMLISNKQDLEAQVCSLQAQLSQTESNYTMVLSNYNYAKHKLTDVENELKSVLSQYSSLKDEIKFNETVMKDLHLSKMTFSEENNNLLEQLEYTKTALTAKEVENESLNNVLNENKNQLEATQLKLQQLMGTSVPLENINNRKEEGALTEKICTLEQQVQMLQKDREQINVHYEQYVGELNNQLRFIASKNEELNNQIQILTQRESSLVEQLSELEIRLQNYQANSVSLNNNEAKKNIDLEETQKKYMAAQEELKIMKTNIDQLQQQLKAREDKIKDLNASKEAECNHDVIEFTKLNADITSDKIAAQRATEQNKKLKVDLQELEQAFVKMSQDKLDLTEKLTAEKYLNRELTIKLAEIDEKSKDMHSKLMAKDDEMIRLLSNQRALEIKLDELSKTTRDQSIPQEESDNSQHLSNLNDKQHLSVDNTNSEDTAQDHNVNCEHSYLSDEGRHDDLLKKEEAMRKLQERFLKIMDDLATLADEKHQLEHINLQLQGETETICEYIALYQQQRSLLKKRDEERSTQIKLFQTECDRLRNHLDELSLVLQKFLEDKDLVSYFETKHTDVNKVMKLLSHLKNNLLIDPNRNKLELKNFYPCSCCSGQLIDV